MTAVSPARSLIDLWFGSPGMPTVTAAEVPALAITTLAAPTLCELAAVRGRRSHCYAVSDISAWAISPYYYAQSNRLAWSTFAFPRRSTLDDVLEGSAGMNLSIDAAGRRPPQGSGSGERAVPLCRENAEAVRHLPAVQ